MLGPVKSGAIGYSLEWRERKMNDGFEFTRRDILREGSVATALLSISTQGRAEASRSDGQSRIGLVIYDCRHRREWMRRQDESVDLFEPMAFLRHCVSVGAGGMQASLGVLSSREIGLLIRYASEHQMFIDAIVQLPQTDQDIERFDAEIQTARDVGVQAARTTIIPGRRYERFKTLDDFRDFEKRGREMVIRAIPILEKHEVKLAIENHKDQRMVERLALLHELDSEFVGACIDTGNSFALLDGAYEPIEALARFAFSVHLKDQALMPYENGFLLGDIPLGRGSLDLKRIVRTIRTEKPNVRICLELITRDPLRVPCLSKGYYATFPSLPATDLASSLRFVRDHRAKSAPSIGGLSLEQKVALEDANIAESLTMPGGN